jgi:hypothetical protein
MTDDKPKPMDDLKQGLGLLLRAAKNAVETVAERVPTDKIEEAASDAVKEVSRALGTVGSEIEKVVAPFMGSGPSGGEAAAPATPPPATTGAAPPAPAPPQESFDDAYAPEPAKDPRDPRGPRVG